MDFQLEVSSFTSAISRYIILEVLIAGIILSVLGAIVFSYCMVGMKQSEINRPKILNSKFGFVLRASGIILIIIVGILLLFISNWIWGIVTLVGIWFIIPSIIILILMKLLSPLMQISLSDAEL